MKTVVRSLASPNRFLREQTAALRRHLDQCELARGRLFPAAMMAERVHVFVVPRFVSTVVFATVLMYLLCGGH
jgi:hypothetical protein